MDLPKIKVDNKGDIIFIATSLRKAAQEQLENNYGSQITDPEMKQQVESYLDQWVEDVLGLASGNIEINGIPYAEAFATEEQEPFDLALHKRAQAKQVQVEEKSLLVGERRKRVPEQVKMLIDDTLCRQSALPNRMEFENDEFEEEDVMNDEDTFKLNNPDLVAQEYATTMNMLSQLKQSVSLNVGRIGGAQAVVENVLKESKVKGVLR